MSTTELDLLITGAEVIDGTGAPRRAADIGIKDGRIVEIGHIASTAAEVVECEGLMVCPGFIDVHTHFDAQLFWDPYLTPSSLHGITTVVGGNCGFSIAPLAPSTADYIAKMLSRVEGMPLESLRAGVPWDWYTTSDYLDRVEPNLALNVGFMVGHSPIRCLVLGEDATRRAATSGEIDQMAELLRAGLAAGGLGFSSSWGPTHLDASGTPVPSRFATREELLALSAVCSEFPGTSLEFIPRRGPGLDDDSIDLMTAMSAAARRPLNWNSLRVEAANVDQAFADLRAGEQARQHGGEVVALTMPMKSRGRFSFHTAFVLDGLPGWGEVMSLPVEARTRQLADPAVRRALAAGAVDAPDAMRWITDWGSKVIAETFDPDLKHYEGRVVGDIASDEGKTAFDALLDIVVADGLRSTFSLAANEMSEDDWAAAVSVWRDGRAVIGASDAGAHLDFTANYDYPVYVLEHAVRRHRALAIEEAVHYLTEVPARLYGMRDRGRLDIGTWADLVVIDPESIGSGPISTRFDLPGGAGRLYAEPTGVRRVYVNGRSIVEDGVLTGAQPGHLLRGGRDTGTPDGG